MDKEQRDKQQRDMLTVLLSTCETALEVFRSANDPVAADLMSDLERVAERARGELVRFNVIASVR